MENAMFEYPINPFQNRHILEDCASNKQLFLTQYNTALNCFKSAWVKGIVFRLFARILRRKACLQELNDIQAGLKLHSSHYSGLRVVSINSIVGTEGKASDFDLRFHPRSEASRERWVNVAMEYLCCFSTPPVQLTRIGNAYFVRDGHHRISVARAFGQTSIDAEVVTWNASQPFSWQPDTVHNLHGLQQADFSA
jgi:hypothetical protein